MRHTRAILEGLSAAMGLCLGGVLFGCQSQGAKTTNVPKNGGVHTSDIVFDDQMWGRNLDATVKVGVDSLKSLQGAEASGSVKRDAVSVASVYSDHARSFRDRLSYLYRAVSQDYSQAGHSEAERASIRAERNRLVMLAGFEIERAQVMNRLVDAYVSHPSDVAFKDLKEAIIQLMQKNREEGVTTTDPATVPPLQSQTMSSGRDSAMATDRAMQVTNPVAPMKQVRQDGDHATYNEFNIQIIINGAAQRLESLGVEPQEISRRVVEAMVKEGLKPMTAEVKPTVGWQRTADGKAYIVIPFQPNNDTRITNNFDTAPFLSTNRKARIEVANVRSEDVPVFHAHVKSDVPMRGDGDRQVDDGINPGHGDEFLIERKAGKDAAYYLAWRGKEMSKEEFHKRNPNAVVVIKLLD